MRILLTQPRSTSSKTPVVPYAQLTLAAAIEDVADVAVTGTAMDGTLPAADDIMRRVADFAPDVVGISISYAVGFSAGLDLARRIKQYDSAIRVIGGGHHATFAAVELLQSGWFDAVFLGEGEASLRAFALAGDYRVIPGVIYRANGEPVRTGRAPLVSVDELRPPAYHLLPRGMKIVVGTETSRGCPYRCDFCETSQFFGNGVLRKKSPRRFIEHMRQIVDTTGGGNFFLMDDCFTADMKKHVKPICEALIAEQLPASLCFQGRLDDLAAHPELVPLLVRAGFTSVVMGVETIYEETLKLMNKRARYGRDEIRSLVSLCRDSGMAVFAAIVFGYPGETPARVADTIDFLTALEVECASITIATPIPGSPLYQRAVERNELLAHDYGMFDGTHRLLASIPETTPEAVYDGIRAFYLRPAYIKRTLENAIDPAQADVRTYFPAGVMSHNLATKQSRPRTADEWVRLWDGIAAVLGGPHAHGLDTSYSARLGFEIGEVQLEIVVKGGQLASVGAAVGGPPDLVVAGSADTFLDLVVWCPLDVLSALLLGRLRAHGAGVRPTAAFVHWFHTVQAILRWAITIRWSVPAVRGPIEQWIAADETRQARWRQELGEHGAVFVGAAGGPGLLVELQDGTRVRDVVLLARPPAVVSRDVEVSENELGRMLAGGLATLFDALASNGTTRATGTPDVFGDAASFFATLPAKFRPARAREVDLVVQYVIGGQRGAAELHWLQIRSGELSLGRGLAPEHATATVTVARDAFVKLANGHVSPIELFQRGEMTLRGFPQTMIQMASCFDDLFGGRG